MTLLLMFQASCWIWAAALNSYLAIMVKRAWDQKDWWPGHIANIASWQTYFKEHVASNWTFYDGQGF